MSDIAWQKKRKVRSSKTASIFTALLAGLPYLTGCAMSGQVLTKESEDPKCAPEVSLLGLPLDAVLSGQVIAKKYVVVVLSPTEREKKIHVLVKKKGQWKAYFVAEKSSVEGLYFSKSNGKFFIWTMFSDEGPGPGWSGTAFSENGVPSFCVDVIFPDDLNKPDWQNEYLELDEFNLDENGHGTLVGHAHIDRAGEEEIWTYKYDSTTDGRVWGNPARIEKPILTKGVFQKFMYFGSGAEPGPELDGYLDELHDLRTHGH